MDSGADTCLINMEIFFRMEPRPHIQQEVSLRVVGEGLTTAYEIELVFTLGSTTYKGLVFAAKLRDDFLLGLDFLKATTADVLISEQCLWVGGPDGEKIPARFRTNLTSFVGLQLLSGIIRKAFPPWSSC